MYLDELHILNYKNIREAQLHFADKLNCFVGLNGQGKTNILDAIYLLSFTKSAYNAIDSLNITHGEEMAMVQGVYREETLSNSPLKGEKIAGVPACVFILHSQSLQRAGYAPIRCISSCVNQWVVQMEGSSNVAINAT